MKEWITLIAAILIVLLVVDGLRRARNSRQGKIRMSSAMKKRLKQSKKSSSREDSATYSSELPNGGARVISRRATKESSGGRFNFRSKKPEQATPNLGGSVPLLMEEVSESRSQIERIEPVFSAASNPASHYQNEAEDINTADYVQDELLENDPLYDEENDPLYSSREEPDEEDENEDEEDVDEYDRDYSSEYPEDDTEEEEEYDEDLEEYDRYDGDEDLDDDLDDDEDLDDDLDNEPLLGSSTETRQQEPEEVLIINIMAPGENLFSGAVLLDTLLQCGMRFGDMNIFHRYSDIKGEGALLFSMVNMVKPGTFDLDTMDEFETPGISLFMTLPLNADSMQSFELMVETAQRLAKDLDGELKDDQRSVMTKQTIEHCRQRILDFERRRLFQRKR